MDFQFKTLFMAVCLLSVYTLFGQGIPDWLDADMRAVLYPSDKYLVGYASGDPKGNEPIDRTTERIKNVAQSYLLESIRMNMESNTKTLLSSENINGQYSETEAFINQTSKSSVAEIVGMKTEAYFDKKEKTVYALAYVKRDEAVAYHKALLLSNISQAEGLLTTAQRLYSQNDRSIARDQVAMALSLFDKIGESQSLLIALDSKATEDFLQQGKSKSLYKSLLQLQSQLDPKYEIIENLQSDLAQKLLRAESLLQTSLNLVNDGEKAKARQQCELAKNMLPVIRAIQDSMQQADPSVSTEVLEQNRTEKLHNDINLLSAQLMQAVMVYIESQEDVFGKQENIIANKLKSQMAVNGCSFAEDISNADFKLTLTAETREGSDMNNLVFCYADINYELYDTHKQKTVFSDNISEKGGSSTKDKAARKAMENSVNKIMESILKWLK